MEQKRRGGDCGSSSPSAMVASKLMCMCVLLLSYVDSTAATASCATNDLGNVTLFSTSTLKCSNPNFADSNNNAFILWVWWFLLSNTPYFIFIFILFRVLRSIHQHYVVPLSSPMPKRFSERRENEGDILASWLKCKLVQWRSPRHTAFHFLSFYVL